MAMIRSPRSCCPHCVTSTHAEMVAEVVAPTVVGCAATNSHRRATNERPTRRMEPSIAGCSSFPVNFRRCDVGSVPARSLKGPHSES